MYARHCSPVYKLFPLEIEPSFGFLLENLNPNYLELARTSGPSPNFKDQMSGQGQATK